jgi:hypothetical protein
MCPGTNADMVQKLKTQLGGRDPTTADYQCPKYYVKDSYRH